ncbi:MAG: RagB/SusD family nutrient uptake outer membrane protein [Bacteroidota bacterium]
MKKVILFILFTLTLSSCDKFLEAEPENFFTTENYYTKPEHAESALNAVYAFTRSFYIPSGSTSQAAYLMLELPTGQARRVSAPINNQVFTDLTYDAQSYYALVWWKYAYKGIAAANVVLKYVPGITMNEQRKKQILGEARFLRAWYYFNLVRIFGDVVKITEPTPDATNVYFGRSSLKSIYEEIIVPDLTAAELSGLPETDQTGRVSTLAIKSLLAKVYLTMAGFPLNQNDKYSLAKQKAGEVISSGKYSLFATYEQLRNPSNDNKGENIFMVQFASGIEDFILNKFMVPRNVAITVDRGAQNGDSLRPDDAFYASFSSQDLRKKDNQFFYTSYLEYKSTRILTFADGPRIFKFFDENAEKNNAGRSGKAFPLIRYADVLLTYAEAQTKADGAPNALSYTSINLVKQRAQLSSISNQNATQFIDEVLIERNKELCFENQTWFDMVRTRKVYDVKANRMADFIGYTFPYSNSTFTVKLTDKNLFFPVPSSEIDANPLLKPNNAGY